MRIIELSIVDAELKGHLVQVVDDLYYMMCETQDDVHCHKVRRFYNFVLTSTWTQQFTL
jgi:hypothetical protein